MITTDDEAVVAMSDALAASIASYDADPIGYSEQYELVDVSTLVGWVADRQPAGSRVVDVGCGSGRDTSAFAALGYRAVGVDLSAGMLAWARAHHPNVGYVRADARALPMSDASVEVIWAMASLVHLDSDEVVTALEEFRRVLVADGNLFLSLPRGTHPDWRRSRSGARWFRYFDTQTIEGLVTESGFVIERLEETPGSIGGSWINILATR